MKIAIIGAGFSGCNLYDNLKLRYEDITIFEKSRGVGGRLSTKYIDDKFIDHGTSTIIPITDDLKSYLLDMTKQNVLKNRYDEFKPKNGINQICKFLIKDKDLVKNTKISKILKNENKWQLFDDKNNEYKNFDLLFLTIPATQILQIDISLEKEIKDTLESITYDSIFTVILYSKKNKKIDISKFYNNKNIENIVDNSKKYLYKDFSSYVIHSTKEFANKYNDKSKEDILNILLDDLNDEIKEELKNFEIIPHLWKYAFSKKTCDLSYYYDDRNKLGICGDYFNYSNLEASLLSSELLGNINY